MTRWNLWDKRIYGIYGISELIGYLYWWLCVWRKTIPLS